VGWANITSGTLSFPGELAGAKVAEAALNANGGINGTKLNLVYCDMQNSTQASAACGEQFAGDSSISLAIYTINPITGASFFAPLNAAHKPILGGVPTTIADDTAKDTYFAYPGLVAFTQGNAAVIRKLPGLGYTKLSYIYETGNQSAGTAAHISAQAATSVGVSVKFATMDPTSADFINSLTEANASSAQVLFLGGSQECTHIARDLQTLGLHPKLVVANIQCVNPDDITKNPDLYQGWLINDQNQEAVLGPGKNADVTQFLSDWAKYGPGGPPSSVPLEAEEGYGTVMTLALMLKNVDVKSLTPAAARTAISSYKGHVVMGGTNDMSCPGPAAGPAECSSNNEVFYKLQNGQFTPIDIATLK
jgi:ABC-type branched-subunit amino acid transport system substrate-binding protein